MRKLHERDLTRSFLNILNENHYDSNRLEVCAQCGQNPCRCIELCGVCHCDPCSCPGHQHEHEHGESHSALHHGEDGIINKEELYNHFDLDNDGVVTTDEYADHIEYHAAHPESLDKYRSLRSDSCNTVPCSSSYDSCGSYCMSDPESMKSMLDPILSTTGAKCHVSAVQSMLDVLKSLKDCGVI